MTYMGQFSALVGPVMADSGPVGHSESQHSFTHVLRNVLSSLTGQPLPGWLSPATSCESEQWPRSSFLFLVLPSFSLVLRDYFSQESLPKGFVGAVF